MNAEEKMARMKELNEILSKASRAYYQEAREIMSNREYDELYDELVRLENETGIVLAGSPTVTVGYEVVSELPKRQHDSPMLSLDKTKDVDALAEWLGDHKGVLSWKLDGLTVVLTYENGELSDAVTRGNGEVGEVVTANAKTFINLPRKIAFQNKLVIRCEAVISYSDFEDINRMIEDADSKYKNPRNLCAGSVRQLSSEVTAQRKVRAIAFALISAEGMEFATITESFRWLQSQGFETVEFVESESGKGIPAAVKSFAERIEKMEIPSDGLVLSYDDIGYGRSLGRTAKFPRHSIAFKWADEVAETTFRYIDWSPSRTGLINPVAVFDPVELEGTTVTRASVHNVSILEELALGAGDRITVYKANMIIPQINENLTKSGPDELPRVCPVCRGTTQVVDEAGVKTLHCTNPDCQAKNIKRFALMTEREGLNIEGLSEATLERFIDEGIIRELSDIFRLESHRETIVSLEGFGERSFVKLQEAVENARKTTLPKFLYSLGITGVGVTTAKLLSRAFEGKWELFKNATEADLTAIEGIGPVLAEGIIEWQKDERKMSEAERLLAELSIEIPANAAAGGAGVLAGMTFVITGSVNHFANRDELKEYIESLGGKATGSVTSKTTALINNDVTSTSGKNKKAKELGIEIISEDEFLRRAGNAD